MNYEQMLDSAYESVKQVECCERFEVLKVKGHHEGSRTVVTNFAQIAACLRRDQNHLIKFLNKELASSSTISGDRLIFSRKLPSVIINDKVLKYANKFVFCSKCKKPDTELVCEGGKTFVRCLACGEKREVHKV